MDRGWSEMYVTVGTKFAVSLQGWPKSLKNYMFITKSMEQCLKKFEKIQSREGTDQSFTNSFVSYIVVG